jgi:alpha-glucosidase
MNATDRITHIVASCASKHRAHNQKHRSALADFQEVNVPNTGQGAAAPDWWRTAAIYEVYVRSFADGSGDGIGDLAGVRARLPYLAELGIDAIWFTPWYPSPMADAGYDVSDYRAIEPLFGSLAEAEKLIAEAHALGIRIIIDVVPNHGSDQQPWFTGALAAAPGSAERARYHFRPGRGARGELPPNDWTSMFGGPAWTRVPDPDGGPGEWYLHLFTPGQPDFNWAHPDVRAEFASVLRFWFDRGVDGFRVDSAALLAKDPGLADLGATPTPGSSAPVERATSPEGQAAHPATPHPFIDRDEVHGIYQEWRRIADSYAGDQALIGEVWLPDAQRLARYLRPGELHSVFNFDFLCCAWDADALRGVIDATLDAHDRVGAAPTWVLSNHDVVRHVTRYGRADTAFSMTDRQIGEPSDLALGTRRARAAALLTFSLPGAVYLYQGDELGLPEVEDLPEELLQDPMWERSGRTNRGRDGCRVPLPWSGDAAPFGYGPEGSTPWLPQPAEWKNLTAETQAGDPGSMLALYRTALRRRRAEPALSTDGLTWLPSPGRVLCFQRGDGPAAVTVIVNLSAGPVPLPPAGEILLSSAPVTGGVLAPDTAVWLRAP